MKNFKTKMPLDLLVILLTIVVSAVFYKYLPNTMRTHGNNESFGNVMPKYVYIMIMPLCMLLLSVLIRFKDENKLLAFFCNLLLLAIDILIMYKNIK